MTNLDSILKSRDVTLSTKVHLIKAMVFLVVMFGCESWTVKKAEWWRIDVFELCCWRRLLRVLWTARRSNQSILTEISPGYALAGLMLKLKLQHFGYLMWRTDALEKTLILGKIEGGRRKGWQRMRWLDGITDLVDMVWVNSRSWWWTGRPGVLQSMGSQIVGHDWVTELNWTELCAVVQSLSHVWIFSAPWTTAHQPSLSITNSWSVLKLMSIELVMPSSHLILCHTVLLPPSIFPSISVFSNESALHIRWPKYWSFIFSLSPSNEHSGLISFRVDLLDLLAVQGTLKSLLQHHSSKASVLQHSAFFIFQLSHPYTTTGKSIALTRWTFVAKVMSLLFNILSRLVITFLPSHKRLLIAWLQLPSAVILEPLKIKSESITMNGNSTIL